ncbi:MAG: Smr/MutS family protein [Myxococcota bacterium]
MTPRDDPPDDERALFEQQMAGVRRIERDRHLPEIQRRTPVPLSAREREALRELDRVVSGEQPLELHQTDEFLEGAVPGLDPRVRKQLRNGEFSVQADLDLHGLDAATARVELERFVLECHAEGMRCLRVVHGRGRRSPDGVPVLKRSMPRWLSRGPVRGVVLAFTSAQPHDGGTGASYLLLRRRGGRPSRRRPL